VTDIHKNRQIKIKCKAKTTKIKLKLHNSFRCRLSTRSSAAALKSVTDL
jgi:hypothetical protein